MHTPVAGHGLKWQVNVIKDVASKQAFYQPLHADIVVYHAKYFLLMRASSYLVFLSVVHSLAT